MPKGAMLTHRNIIANLRQMHAWLAPSLGSESQVFVTALPLYHVFSLLANCFVPAMIGATNLLIANPRDIPAVVKDLRRTPFTVITGVNTLFNAFLNNEDFTRLDFSRLHLAVGGGMAVQRAVADRWKSVTGKPLIEAYGLTETSPAAIANPLTIENFNGAIGLPLPSTDIAIRDDGGRDLPIGEIGELCIKGPQVMAGYWKKPEETAKVMTADGFLRTGDIVRVDERGYVFVVDRKKDMIIVSGFNVYPNEIEDVVMSHPGVLEVGAVGVPDAKTGEAVKIVVVRKDEALTEADLIAHCRQNLTGYKTPRHVEFRSAAAHHCRENPAPRTASASNEPAKDEAALRFRRSRALRACFTARSPRSAPPCRLADSVSSVARTRLSTCSTEVALAIGAVTPGLAMIQASATSAGLALCRAATASSASRMRNPRGLR